MDEILFRLERRSPSFVMYVKQFPDLKLQVIADALVAFVVADLLESGDTPRFGQLVAGRDAFYRLCGVADGADFGEMALFFYEMYEVLCGKVALYQG